MAVFFVYVVSLAVLFCQVRSQACGPVLLPLLPPCCSTPPPLPCPPLPCPPLPCPPPIAPPCLSPCPQVINPNPQVTTIIDNSVSNALVNALQLLIVSNLIGAAAGPAAPPQTCLSNLGPLLESITCVNPCPPVEVFVPEYYRCLPNFDIIPPCAPITTCGPNFELIPPCGPIIDTFPPPFCGLTDYISPNYYSYTETINPIFGNCIDTLPPNIFNGYPEPYCPIYGIETIGPNFCGGLTEILIPNCPPVNDICPNYYAGFPETIPPAVAALAPNMFGGLTEVIAPKLPYSIYGGFPEVLPPFGPLAALAPNYYGGLTEVVSQVPLAAELVFPSALPAQLTCNFGYTPSSLPCVRVNVEPLPYDPCVCNGYGGPIYY